MSPLLDMLSAGERRAVRRRPSTPTDSVDQEAGPAMGCVNGRNVVGNMTIQDRANVVTQLSMLQI